MSFQQVEILSKVDDQLTSFQHDLKFIDIERPGYDLLKPRHSYLCGSPLCHNGWECWQ